jgi:hypothetical protein
MGQEKTTRRLRKSEETSDRAAMVRGKISFSEEWRALDGSISWKSRQLDCWAAAEKDDKL